MIASLLGLLLLVAITFAPSLGGRFLHWDDYSLVVGNPQLNPATLASLRYFWTHAHVALYTPMAYSLWTAVAHLAPPGTASAESAAAFHQLNLLLWLVAAGMAFILLRQLIDSPSCNLAAFIGAAVFATHPLQVEPVAWISGMNNLLATMLSIAALSAYVAAAKRSANGSGALLFPSPSYSGEWVRVRGRAQRATRHLDDPAPSEPLTPALSPEYEGEGVHELQPSGGCSPSEPLTPALSHEYTKESARRFAILFYFAATLLFAAALLSKPTAVVTPLLAIVIDRLLLRRRWRSIAVFITPWVLMALVMALVARAVQPPPPSEGRSILFCGLIGVDSLNQYLWHLVWPADLCVDYGRSPTWLAQSGAVKACWIAPAALLLLAIALRRRFIALAAALLIFALAMLPTLGFTSFEFQAYSTVADRYANLALLGPGLLVAAIVARWPKVAGGPALAMVFVLAFISHFDCLNWDDTTSLVTRTLTINPTSLMANRTLSATLLDAGQLDQAEAFAQRAIAFHPEAPGAKLNLAAVKMARHDLDGAIAVYRDALAQRPNFPSAQANLASALAQEGKLDEALPHARAAVSGDPQDPMARQTLGTILAQLNRPTEAIEQLTAAVQIAPADARTATNLAMLLAASGRREEAMVYLHQALAGDPQYGPAARALASLRK